MAVEPFTIYPGGKLFTEAMIAEKITGNGKFILEASDAFPNSQAKTSIFVDVDYRDILPDPNTSQPGWSLRAIVESSNGENGGTRVWHPIGVQFEPLRHPSQGTRQIIYIQPDILNLDEGVPVDVWDGQGVAQRINRQQGSLGVDFRVVIEVIETKFGTADALKGLRLWVGGERYNHV
jgi:hypothetical protein